jgi:hypothetical protein
MKTVAKGTLRGHKSPACPLAKAFGVASQPLAKSSLALWAALPVTAGFETRLTRGYSSPDPEPVTSIALDLDFA